jgi:hypothetical protein
MSNNYEYNEKSTSTRKVGFEGAISEMMNRKQNKLFPSLTDILDEE